MDSCNRPTAKELLRHRWIRSARRSSTLTSLVERYEKMKEDRPRTPASYALPRPLPPAPTTTYRSYRSHHILTLPPAPTASYRSYRSSPSPPLPPPLPLPFSHSSRSPSSRQVQRLPPQTSLLRPCRPRSRRQLGLRPARERRDARQLGLRRWRPPPTFHPRAPPPPPRPPLPLRRLGRRAGVRYGRSRRPRS